MKFSEVLPETKPAPATLVLPPSAFMPNWPDAPRENVCVGITLLCEGDITGAKQAAVTEAWRLYPRKEDASARLEAIDDLLMRWLVARGTCDPNNVAQPFGLWAVAAEDTIKEALTSEACKAIWDAMERAAIELSPVVPEASSDEILAVYVYAQTALDRMPEWRAKRVRRLLHYCLTELTPYVADDAGAGAMADG